MAGIEEKTFDEPIPFITIEEDGQFSVNPVAQNYLSGITGKIAVVSVAGQYRTGKSYLLNKLINTRQGFEVGSTVNACTKGIWLWGRPIEHNDTTFVFLDTEGLASTTRDASYDSRIFALAILLSSYFIYNSLNVIDESAIEGLSLVVNLTKHIHTKAGQDEDSGAEFSQFFPTFMWVVRDFALQLREGGNKITPKQYLENALKLQGGAAGGAQKKNQIRSMITTFFQERDCVTLPKPATDEQLGHLNSLPEESLRQEFVKPLRKFLEKVYTAKPKSLYGRNLNGGMLAKLATEYVEAINQGGVPTISNAWDRVVQSQAEEAKIEAFELYRTQMSSRCVSSGLSPSAQDEPKGVMPLEQGTLDAINRHCKTLAKKKFLDLFMEASPAARSAKLELREMMQQEFDRFVNQNKRLSLDLCKRKFDELVEKSDKQLFYKNDSTHIADIDTYFYAIQNFPPEFEVWRKTYTETVRGPHKMSVLAKGIEDEIFPQFVNWGDAVVKCHRHLVRTKQDEVDKIQRQSASIKGEHEALKHIIEEERLAHSNSMESQAERFEQERLLLIEQLNERARELKHKQEYLLQQNELHKSDRENLMDQIRRLREEVDDYKQRLKQERADLQSEIRETNNRLWQREKEFREAELTLVKEKAELQAQLTEAQRDAVRRFEGLEESQKASVATFMQKLSEDRESTLKVVGSNAERLQRLELENGQLHERYSKAQIDVQDLQIENAKLKADSKYATDRSSELERENKINAELIETLRVQIQEMTTRADQYRANASEAEYQWGNCKARVAQLEGEKMTLEYEVKTLESILKKIKANNRNINRRNTSLEEEEYRRFMEI